MPERSRTLLIVEDHNDIRDAIAQILVDEGWTVVGAANGEEALQQLARIPPPDVILADRIMPVLSGAEFVARLRTDPVLRKVPVVEMSASELSPSEGASAMLRKPFTPELLLSTIEKQLQASPLS